MVQEPRDMQNSAFFLLTSVVAAFGADATPSFQIEENRGQVEGPYRFLIRTAGYHALLSRDELQIHPLVGPPLQMRFAGASSTSSFEPGAPAHGRVNYFQGPNESAWLTNIPTHETVTLHSVYQGIDVKYREGPDGLEYDFLVAPRADASRIKLGFRSESSVRVRADGSLVTGTVHHHRPVAYQVRHGRLRKVACRYAVHAGIVRFRLGPYHRSESLIIDPAIGLMPIAGTAGASVVAAATDSEGNMYLTGRAGNVRPDGSTAFPNTPGAFDSTRRTNYVMKLSPEGKLLFATYFGGFGADRINGLAVDAQGNCYLTGSSFLSDFPVTGGAFQTQPKVSGTHAFASKLSAAGDTLLYSTYLSGSGMESGNAITVDSSGRAYVAGTSTWRFDGSHMQDFPTTPQALMPSSSTQQIAFITRLSPDGGTLEYSSFLGDAGDSPGAVSVDAAGNMYIAGATADGATSNTAHIGAYGADLVGSSDGGASWNTSHRIEASHVYSVAASPLHSDIVYRGGDNGVERSYDRGATWEFTALKGSFAVVLWVKPMDSRVVLADFPDENSFATVFRSEDGGLSWTKVSNYLAAITSDLDATVLYGTAGPSLNQTSRSDNQGKTWRLLQPVFGRGSTSPSNHAIDPTNTNVLYATPSTSAAQLFKSGDGGATWSVINPRNFVIPFLVDRSDPAILYGAGAPLGIVLPAAPVYYPSLFLKSTDQGATWRLPASGQAIPASQVMRDPGAPNRLYAIGPIGVFRSSDSGESWENLSAGMSNRNVLNGAIVFGGNDVVLAVCQPGSDIFVSKLDPSGSKLIYRTQIGGSAHEILSAMTVNDAGEVLLAGSTESPDFPVSSGGVQRQLKAMRNGFVAKLSADGQQLNQATFLGGGIYDSITSMASIPGGVAVGGSTSSSDFPVTDPASRATPDNDFADGFVTILNTDLTGIRYSVVFGGTDGDYVTGLATANGLLFVAGWSNSSDFPSGLNPSDFGSIFYGRISY